MCDPDETVPLGYVGTSGISRPVGLPVSCQLSSVQSTNEAKLKQRAGWDNSGGSQNIAMEFSSGGTSWLRSLQCFLASDRDLDFMRP